jgi:hypothetical protein
VLNLLLLLLVVVVVVFDKLCSYNQLDAQRIKLHINVVYLVGDVKFAYELISC